MEFLARSGIVLEQLTGFELGSVCVGKSIHEANVVVNANGVKIAEWSTSEGGEASAKDEADITSDRISNDLVLQTFGRLVHKAGDDSVLDLLFA